MGSTQNELIRLKLLLQSMSRLSNNSISLLCHELRSMKEDSQCDKMKMVEDFKRIEDTWNCFKSASEKSERELINRLTVDHELELNDMRKLMLKKEDTIDLLKCDNKALQARIQANETLAQETYASAVMKIRDLEKRLADLAKQVSESEIDKEKAVNMVKEKMIRDHKTEIESLRCRFKLMTTTERSDTSLEKIDHPEVLDCDRSRSTTVLASSPKSPSSNQNLLKRILDEKERQQDLLNSQIDVLRDENMKLKECIQSLADTDQNQHENVVCTLKEQQHENVICKLKEQIEGLQKDKLKMRQKLNLERSRRMDATTLMDMRYVSTSCVIMILIGIKFYFPSIVLITHQNHHLRVSASVRKNALEPNHVRMETLS